jgi:hypothetical protein
MNNLILLSIILLIVITNNYCLDNNDEEIIFVYEHCRHGNRAPNDKKNGLYNNVTKRDAYNIYWEKPGALTESGKLQHFFLGLRNKYRYKKLINFTKYDKNEILVRTTGSKRSTESLYYQLLGMYYQEDSNNNKSFTEFNDELYKYSMPPNSINWESEKEFEELNKKIRNFTKNQKIEGINLSSFNSETKKYFNIKTIKNDFIFITNRCKNHKKYIKKQRDKYKEVIKNNFVDNYYSKIQKIINYQDESFFYKYSISKSLADHFISDYSNGRKELMNFSKDTGINLEDYYQRCYNVYFFFMYNVYCYSKTCILSVSRLMNEIIKYFDNAIESNDNKNKKRKMNKEIKMMIDLGHDVTVNNFHILIYKVFNINYTFCTFACNIYFELIKNKRNNKYLVKYYNNDLLMLSIEYYDFKKRIIKFLWSDKDIDIFCNGKKENIFKIHKEQDLINDNGNDYHNELNNEL